MKKSKFSEEQIVRILKEVEAGAKVAETCRKHGISEPTYYVLTTESSTMLRRTHPRRHQRLCRQHRRLPRSDPWAST